MIETDVPGIADAGWPYGTVRVETTGRSVVVFERSVADAAGVLASVSGLDSVANSRDFAGQAVDFDSAEAAGSIVFAELDVAVISADEDQLRRLRTATEARGAIISVSPELIYHVLAPASDYVQGYRDGVTDLTDRLGATDSAGRGAGAATAAVSFADTAQFTWGLQATGVSSSPYSGQGIKVAVLDTGFDAGHPDFTGRSVLAESFVAGQPPQDGHGHGTHCIGTSCGPKTPATGPRYGIAYEADILVGKVLSNAGSGSDGGIIAGINWAISNQANVISMSLGADVAQVHPPYTAVGQRALDAGSLIVAAAGNNAARSSGNFGFVGAPANSPYILAVAALDQQLATANFSARSLPGRGGQVDIAGPGVQVYSSWPLPTQYRTISGTSMATPHVAGIAALWAQQTGYRGRELWATLAQESQRLVNPSVDVGGGLALAPQ